MAPGNSLPIHGNEKTMNLNSMILTNIQSSPYFKNNLYELKTYHEVIDEIYYKVNHLEPWEKGSRKTAGQTGMCGGVRGVGAGGIVSSAYCLLYKLFTLRLTRKQVMGLVNHADSSYIRGMGFMYIRYTQPPADLFEWFEDYLDDPEEVDAKAGGGCSMAIGDMLRQWLVKLDWYATLFPRIPVPIQKQIEQKLRERQQRLREETGKTGDDGTDNTEAITEPFNRRQAYDSKDEGSKDFNNTAAARDRERDERDHEFRRRHEEFDREKKSVREHRSKSKDRDRKRDRTDHHKSSRDRHFERSHHSRHGNDHRSHHRSRSRSRDRRHHADDASFEDMLRREKDRQRRAKDRGKEKSSKHHKSSKYNKNGDL